MSYTFKKPDSGPSPLLDASNIQGNFSTYGTVFGKNHVAMNGNNQGDHENIIFETQTLDPGIDTNIDVIFSRNATMRIGIQPEVFLRIPKFLPKTPDWTQNLNDRMQLTYSKADVVGPQYQSWLFGNVDNASQTGAYLIYFGKVSGNTNGNLPTTDTVILLNPPTTLLLAIAHPNTLTTSGFPLRVKTTLNTVTNASFDIVSSGNNTNTNIPYSFLWMAIGRQ